MLVYPIQLSKDLPLLWSKEVYTNDGKYLLLKVPKRFSDRIAGIILYFVWISWWDMNTVRLFCYLKVSISKYEKTLVKVVKGSVLANSHVSTEFYDSDDSPKWAFFIDATKMLAL